jgi:hypothetical protein
MTVLPGFYFRRHYWVPLVPFAAICCGIALWQLQKLLENRAPRAATLVPLATLGLVLLTFFGVNARLFFRLSPDDASRQLYPGNPFPAIKQLAFRLEQSTPPGSKIAVVGSEPELYFYAHRRAATGYLYVYPLMEVQPYASMMQHQMADEIQRSAPGTLVFVAVASSWLRTSKSEGYIFDWFDHYSSSYTQAMVVDSLPSGDLFITGEAAQDYRPLSPSSIKVLRKMS